MSLVNRETGELVEVTYAEVRTSVDAAKASLEEAAEQIVWQIENQAWMVLGYADWDEMREAEYGGAAFIVPRTVRLELSARIRKTGQTHGEIARTAGVSNETIRRDLQTTNVVSEPITNTRGQRRPAAYVKPDPAAQVAEAVAEFPDLAYYRDLGRDTDVTRLGAALRGYSDAERQVRLDALRRTIAADKRGALNAAPTDDRIRKVIGAYFRGNALASGTTPDDLAAQAAHIPAAERDLSINGLTATADYVQRLLDALRSTTLRRIK